MGALEFVSSLVGSLAWPVLLLVIVLIMKKPLKDLFSRERRMQSFEAGPAGLKIQYALDEAQTELDKAPGRPALPPAEDVAPPTEDERPLYEVSPPAAVLESFARLEQALRQALEMHVEYAATKSEARSVRRLIRRAVQLGILSEAEGNAFEELAVIRNFAAHGDAEEVSESAAERFTEIATDLYTSIRLWVRQYRLDGPAPGDAA